MVQILGCLGIDKRASAVKRRPKYGVLWLRVSTEGTKWPRSQASLLQSWVALGQPSGPNLEDSRYGIRHLEQALKTAGRVLQPYLGNGR